jgi:hypothetical protein
VFGLSVGLRLTPLNSLRLVAPVIREHGVEYERCKFRDRLAAGLVTLERTTVLSFMTNY